MIGSRYDEGDFTPATLYVTLDRGFKGKKKQLPARPIGMTLWKTPRDQSCSVSARPSELVCVEAPTPTSWFNLQQLEGFNMIQHKMHNKKRE